MDAGVFTRNGVVDISNSVITQSRVGVGVQADTGATVTVESSMLTQNTNAVCSYSPSTIRLSNNDIFDNGTGIEACGGTWQPTATTGRAATPEQAGLWVPECQRHAISKR